MEESSTQEKLQREAALERRKQARTDIKRLQEQEIALLIARCATLLDYLCLSSLIVLYGLCLAPGITTAVAGVVPAILDLICVAL